MISELQVDNSRGRKMIINLDIEMSQLPCNYFSIDAMETGPTLKFKHLLLFDFESLSNFDLELVLSCTDLTMGSFEEMVKRTELSREWGFLGKGFY